jgi:RNA polymerase sigma factor (sigma-70 family)
VRGSLQCPEFIGATVVTKDTQIGGRAKPFPTTRGSLLEAAVSRNVEERQRALESLIEAYWKPVYKYIRLRWQKSNEEAKDLTQEFFFRALQTELLKDFDPARARLRTFLRVCIDRLVMNEHKSSHRLKRGGDIAMIALDFDAAENELAHTGANANDPEELLAREFARSLFASSLEQLRQECEGNGKSKHYRLLELYDVEEGGKELTYEQAAKELGLKPTDVTNHLAYARRRLRTILLQRLRAITASEAEFRHEARALLGVDPQ